MGQRLETDGGTLHSLGLKQQARLLRKFARACEEEAQNILPETHDGGSTSESPFFRSRRDDPWVLTRRSKDDDELRTYIVCLAITTLNLFGKTFDGTLARIAAVVFGRKVTREMVREMLRNQNLK
jgi:hypothetical protein